MADEQKRRPSAILDQATWRQLVVFEAVARLGGFSKAAKELFTTQPGVSIQVRKLAEAVGLPLFEFVGKKAHLTEAGRETLAFARTVLADAERFEDGLAELKGLKKGRLRLCAVTTAECFLPRLLGTFCDAYPGIDVSLEFYNRERVAERLAANVDDLYVLGRPPAGLEAKTFLTLENPIVPVARRVHPLAKRKAVPLAELLAEAFLVREPGSGTRAALEELVAARGLSLTPRLVLGSNEALKQAALGGLGVCVLPLQAVADSSKLAVLDVAGFPIRRHWHFLHLARKKLCAAAKAFIATLSNAPDEIQAEQQAARGENRDAADGDVNRQHRS